MTESLVDNLRPTRGSAGRPLRLRAGAIITAVVVGIIAAIAGEPRGEDAAANVIEAPSNGAQMPSDDAIPATLGLVAHITEEDLIDVAVLAGVDADRARAAGVLIPPATLIEVPSLGAVTIEKILGSGDRDLLETSLENAFGLQIDSISILDDDALVAALSSAETLGVDLHRPMRISDDRGTLTLAAGPQELTVAEVMRLMTAPSSEGELDRLVVIQAVLDGWSSALQLDEVFWPAITVDPGLAAIAGLGTTDVRWSTLPVTRLIAAADDEIYGLDGAAVDALMASAFPWALLGDGGARPRVELLNGTGAVGVTGRVAQLIVPAGGEVTLTGNVPGFGVTQTKVVYYRAEARAAAEMVLDALGTGTLALADQPLGVIDVTVVIGEDLAGSPTLDDEASDTTDAPPTAGQDDE